MTTNEGTNDIQTQTRHRRRIVTRSVVRFWLCLSLIASALWNAIQIKWMKNAAGATTISSSSSLMPMETTIHSIVSSSVNRSSQKTSSVLPEQETKPPSLLLQVPYYVYEELAWTNATWNGISLEELPLKFSKHSDDYWFMKASLRHPMRTNDPSKAKLFVIPLLLNMYCEGVYQKLHHGMKFTFCHKEWCDKELLRMAYQTLNRSSWFQRYQGRDHIVTTSHDAFWYVLRDTQIAPVKFRRLLYQCNRIVHERRGFSHTKNAPRIVYSSIMVGNPCHPLVPAKEKLHDLAMIATFKINDANFLDRQHVCQWTKDWIHNNNNNNSSSTNRNKQVSMPICGPGSQCPTLGKAKFGFHVRGDSAGSQRLMDTLLSGTVPLFTILEQYDVVPPWFDWSQLSYFVNVTSRTAFIESLQAVLDDPNGYEQRQAAVFEHQPLFDWQTLYPFDTYMYMLQKDLYPKISKTSTHSRFSALILS